MRNSTSKVIDSLLFTLGAAGVAGLCIIAPNSLASLEKQLAGLVSGKEKRREAARIARYLKQQKLVKVTPNEDGSYQVTIGEKGNIRIKRTRLERLDIPNRKWDGKWRVIMFDIPEKHKTVRDYISRHLRMVGFKQLQRSVLVFPYPVDEFIAVLQETFPEASRHVIYITVSDIDQHNLLVKKFSKIL